MKSDAKSSDAKAPESAEKSAPAAIELKLPEGFEADAKQLDAFKATATELGLDGPKAQRIFDQYVAIESARTKAAEDAFIAQDKKWVAELAADPELFDAKAGTLQPGAKRDIGRAVQHFKAHKAFQLVDRAGLGNHPEFVKLFAAIGRSLREDSVAGTSSSAPAAERKSDAEIFYGPTTTASKEQ